MIEERTGIITFQGNPLTLIGKGVSVGEAAPEFCVLANDLTPRTLADYKGKVLVISVVPSLDTPVCDMQTRRFNTEAAKLSDNCLLYTSLRTGLAGKIDGVCLEREHAVQTVPQPLLQIQQITPDKAGRQARHAYHVRRTGTPRSAMYCLSCPIVYSP